MNIRKCIKQDYSELIKIWESSVRATHNFLPEEKIDELRPLILNQYFDAVDLSCAENKDGHILGFCGTHENKVEMLFVDPNSMGNGIGKKLMNHVIDNSGISEVDVNEQNQQACGFYKHLGFEVISRSELDGEGNPFPILHLKLKESHSEAS